MQITTQFDPQDEVWHLRPRIQNVGDKCPVCNGSGKYKPQGATGPPWPCQECDGTGTTVTGTITVWTVYGPHLVDRVKCEVATPSGADLFTIYALLGIDHSPAEGDSFASEAEAETEAAVRNA